MYIKVDDRGYIAEVVVGLMNDGSATYYSLEKMKEKTIVEAPLSREPKRRPSSEETSTANNIPQTGEDVNTESGKNSLRMAETPSVASGDSSPRGGAKAGGLAEEAAQQKSRSLIGTLSLSP